MAAEYVTWKCTIEFAASRGHAVFTAQNRPHVVIDGQWFRNFPWRDEADRPASIAFLMELSSQWSTQDLPIRHLTVLQRLLGEILSSEGHLREAYRAAARVNRRLRIGLLCRESDRLAGLPWEFAAVRLEGEAYRAIATEETLSLVRMDDLHQEQRAFNGNPLTEPLRILQIVATKHDEHPDLRTDRIEPPDGTVASNEPIGGEKVDRDEIERTLRDLDPHVVHFTGHASGDRLELGGGYRMRGDHFAAALGPSARLVVVNACESGERRADSFHSIAGALVRRGVPAVVAMQTRVTDDGAFKFAETFYRKLLQGVPLDECVQLGRRASIVANPNEFEAAKPVIYSRVLDGVILGKERPLRSAASRDSPVSEGVTQRTLSGARIDQLCVLASAMPLMVIRRGGKLEVSLTGGKRPETRVLRSAPAAPTTLAASPSLDDEQRLYVGNQDGVFVLRLPPADRLNAHDVRTLDRTRWRHIAATQSAPTHLAAWPLGGGADAVLCNSAAGWRLITVDTSADEPAARQEQARQVAAFESPALLIGAGEVCGLDSTDRADRLRLVKGRLVDVEADAPDFDLQELQAGDLTEPLGTWPTGKGALVSVMRSAGQVAVTWIDGLSGDSFSVCDSRLEPAPDLGQVFLVRDGGRVGLRFLGATDDTIHAYDLGEFDVDDPR